MVASSNRMFSTKGGKIITLQDAVKAGLADPAKISPIPRKNTVSEEEYKAAVAKRKEYRDEVLASIMGTPEKEQQLIAAAQYRMDSGKITPSTEDTAVMTKNNQGNDKPLSRWGKLIQGFEESDRQYQNLNQQETKIDAKVYGAAAQMLTDAGGHLNLAPDRNALPGVITTQSGKRPNVFQLARQIAQEEKELERRNVDNTVKSFTTAANLMQIRQTQVNEGKTKRVSGGKGKKQKQLKGSKK